MRLALARHPEWWLYAVAGATAAVVAWSSLSASNHVHASGGRSPMPTLSSWSAGWAHWLLMVVAMMLPVVATLARSVALRSLYLRRHRAMAGFLVGYLAVWALLGGAVVLAAGLVDGGPSRLVLVVTLVAAAQWQVAQPRQRAMRRCGSLRLGSGSGWAADRNCAAIGWTAGTRCIVTCGPVMLTMALSHSLVLMVCVLGVMLSERRRGPNPAERAGRPLEAWLLIGLASVVAASLFVA
jgi:hypothetical protein